MEGEKLLAVRNGEKEANGDNTLCRSTDNSGDASSASFDSKESAASADEGDVEMKDMEDKTDEKTDSDGVVNMTYDEALEKYGTGRYQIMLFVLLTFVTFSTVFNNNGYIFIGATQKHVCSVPGTANWTDYNNDSAQMSYVADTCTYSKIARYDNGTNITIERDIECDQWTYDQSEFDLTIMSEWNLNSCSGKWKIALANSMYMIGFFIGCIVLADLSDRYGRSTLLLISNVCMVISGVIASFSVNIEMLIVMRLVLGIFTAGARNAGFVYVCEITKHRAAAGMLHGSVYSLGGLVVTLISQLLPNWRHFQLACACSYVLFIPYYWIMPESPRWMLSHGRTKEANDYFKRSARYNKVPMTEEINVYLEYQPKKEGNVFTLFKTINLRKKTLMVCFLWFSVSVVFFGMNFNVGNLSGNIFTNNYLLQVSGLLEIFGLWYIRLGRRIAISSAFLIACLVSGIIPFLATYEINVAVVAMGMIGKLLIETNFEMIYIVTAEIYPTSARVTALGLGSSIARLGGALSPYLVLTHDAWPNMPYVIFGAISGVAGLIAIRLPETKNKKLPDSLQEAENENPLSSCCCCGPCAKTSEHLNVTNADEC